MSSKDPLSLTLLKKASLASKNRKNGVSIKHFMASSRSVDNDDSFDLFLPIAGKSKYPEVCASAEVKEREVPQKQCPVCLGSFSNVKLHLRHCAKKHKLSDSSLTEALQLQKDYSKRRKSIGLPCTSLEEDEVQAEEVPKARKGKPLKLNGKYLLLSRTKEERVNIIMEKVGILLAQDEESVEFKAEGVEVSSPFLQGIVDKDAKLWEKAKRDGTSEEFYVEPLRPYVVINAPKPSSRPSSPLSQASTEMASPEVVCISSSQDSLGSPSTKSPPQGVVAESPDPPEQSDSPLPDFDFLDAPAESTRLEATLQPDQDLSRTLCEQLADDWESFVGGAYKSDVTVNLQDGTLCAHGIVLFVRCPVLLSETHKTKTVEWPEVPLTVGEAFLTYIYSARTEKISKLSGMNLSIFQGLCDKYRVRDLEGLFNHGSPKRDSLKRKLSEDLFESAKKRRSSPEMVDLTYSPDMMACSLSPPVEMSQNRRRDTLEETLTYNEGVITCSPLPSTSKDSIDKFFQESFPSVHDMEPRTPSPALIVSDKVTPQLDYSNLLSPELQSELRKYGLKPGIGRRKAKMLLRYIYDQIHPIIPECDPGPSASRNDGDTSDSSSSSSQGMSEDYMVSSDSEEETAVPKKDFDSVKGAIVSFIKANDTLYNAILRYTPIWLDEFQQSLKDHGVKCSKNMLKDILDSECVAYRTKRREPGKRRRGRAPKRAGARELRL